MVVVPFISDETMITFFFYPILCACLGMIFCLVIHAYACTPRTTYHGHTPFGLYRIGEPYVEFDAVDAIEAIEAMNKQTQSIGHVGTSSS